MTSGIQRNSQRNGYWNSWGKCNRFQPDKEMVKLTTHMQITSSIQSYLLIHSCRAVNYVNASKELILIKLITCSEHYAKWNFLMKWWMSWTNISYCSLHSTGLTRDHVLMYSALFYVCFFFLLFETMFCIIFIEFIRFFCQSICM